jgi:deoxyribodipyrimidine photo-lyase
MSGLHVVWFKRDLRVTDHRPLLRAAAAGPTLPLYVFEPSVWSADDASTAHLRFVTESLTALNSALADLGAGLVTRVGEVVDVLDRLHHDHGVAGLYSHEETGNALTYARDRAVKRWCRANGVPWLEVPSGGVVRPLPTRDGWARRWDERMSAPIAPAPRRLVAAAVAPRALPDLAAAGVRVHPGPSAAQPGGRAAGEALLASFLSTRGRHYTRAMSSPVSGWDACSRLSPHLAWGTLSTREVWAAVRARQATLRPDRDADWASALRSFASRLRWRDHFMQKLEDEPALEHHNAHHAYDGLRAPDPDRLAAWAAGRTGYPMVDACMRCLNETGWLNFRMRAMLISFAAWDLWLPWREPGLHLARCFVDYEPGIHWSQLQMQSGTFGINTLRIYSPARQALDHDPTGVFRRTWLPELAHLPDAALADAHAAGAAYPRAIVDHAAAVAEARRRVAAVRATPDARAEAHAVWEKHGSRRGARGAVDRPTGRSPQLGLFDAAEEGDEAL